MHTHTHASESNSGWSALVGGVFASGVITHTRYVQTLALGPVLVLPEISVEISFM